jgi:hypothetical protein
MKHVAGCIFYKAVFGGFIYSLFCGLTQRDTQFSKYILNLTSFYGTLRPCKINESSNRPGMAQRVPGGLGSQISWHSAREGGELVSLTHRPPLPPRMFLVLIFTRGWVAPRAMERSEGDMTLKNPVTPPGIDPGTVWLVAQHLNHYATPGPMCSCTHSVLTTYPTKQRLAIRKIFITLHWPDSVILLRILFESTHDFGSLKI